MVELIKSRQAYKLFVKRINGLYERHIVKNGFPVCRCWYANCYYKRKIKELKSKLKEIK